MAKPPIDLVRRAAAYRQSSGGAAVGSSDNTASYNPLTGVAWHHVYWADNPADAFVNGAAVATWQDGGSNNVDLSQASAGSRPIFRSSVAALNGKGGVEFDGSNDVMTSGGFTDLGSYSVVVVLSLLAIPGGFGGCIHNGDDSGSSGSTLAVTVDPGFSFGDFSDPRLISSVTASVAGFAMWAFSNEASSKFAVNGETPVTGTLSTPTCQFDNVGDMLSSLPLNMRLGFLALYDGDVTGAAGWATFKSWVSTYYGLTI